MHEPRSIKMLACDSLSDQLVELISRQIIQNELKPGEVITETKISRKWDVSKSPVKIALRKLEKKKLVEKPLRGSYRVTVLTEEFIDEFCDAVNAFFRCTFLRAAKRITREDTDYFFSILKKMEESIDANYSKFYLEGTNLLMKKVLQTAENRIIEEIVNDLIPSIERVQFAAVRIRPGSAKKSLNQLREICEHLSNNAPEEAVNSFMNFSDTSRKILIDHIKSEAKAD